MSGMQATSFDSCSESFGRPNASERYYVYALRDPDTRDIKYIGMSSNPFARIGKHITDAYSSESGRNTKKSEWIRSLVEKSRIPVIHILEGVSTKIDALKRETFYISDFKSKGCDLLNQSCCSARVQYHRNVYTPYHKTDIVYEWLTAQNANWTKEDVPSAREIEAALANYEVAVSSADRGRRRWIRERFG